MHNRLRMIVASFLTKDLLVDWRWGEKYFADNLNNFDLSANNGGWQWAASVATGATTDLERIIADDFVGVDPQGNLYDKAKMLSNTREAPKYFASNRIGPVKVRFYGETAIAQGEETWVRLRGDPHTGRFVWTDTWVRRSGKWQIVAAQDVIAKIREP